MRYISLCSGVGGLDRALDRVGGECLVQVEIEPYCRSILDLRWPGVPKYDDLRTFHYWNDPLTAALGGLPVDLVAGGIPCQPISHAGRRKGADDPRWLWPDALRVVREAQPARVFFENPMGLRTLGLDAILAELSGMGYGGAWEVVAAADVGAPHLRKRIFIMGIRGRSGWEGPTRPPGNRRVLWPSPNASGERPNGKSVFAAQGKEPAMPTSTARLGGQRGPQAKRYFDRARSNDLDDYVAAYPQPWPTPSASLGPKAGLVTPDKGREGGTLVEAVSARLWPTPRASEWKGVGPLGSKSHEYRLAKGYLDATVQERERRTGQLSPDWCEWLMNWPIGWTDINCAEPGPVYGWESEPAIPRIGLGIPNRSKRLTAIGNGVVTAQAVFAWQRLEERLG